MDIQTTGLFGSVGYDLTDQLSVSVEGRQQWDKVPKAARPAPSKLSDTFTSFYAARNRGLTRQLRTSLCMPVLPREPVRALSMRTWSGGHSRNWTRSEQQSSPGLTVPEEELDSFELGLKGSLMDGRAGVTATLYWADMESAEHFGAFVNCPDGTTDLRRRSPTVGGKIELNGFEFEGALALTDKFRVDATFSINDSEIVRGPCTSHCPVLLGINNVDGLGKRTQKNPKNQGSLGLAYTDQLTDRYDWYARVDYIMTGSRFAGNPNLTETGDSHRVNVRAGVENDTMRVEVFGKNVFDDRTFTNYQILHDFAYLGPRRILTAGLPDKAAWGVRRRTTSEETGVGRPAESE